MAKNTLAVFEILRNDLNKKLKEQQTLKNYQLGDENHFINGKDHRKENDLYKFKIYANNESYPSLNYHTISRETTEIEAYPASNQDQKENYLNDIIKELQEKIWIDAVKKAFNITYQDNGIRINDITFNFNDRQDNIPKGNIVIIKASKFDKHLSPQSFTEWEMFVDFPFMVQDQKSNFLKEIYEKLSSIP